jgi:hypothetical protein
MVEIQSRTNCMLEHAFPLPGPVSATGKHNQGQEGVLTVSVPNANS